jgi:hypothetical protein
MDSGLDACVHARVDAQDLSLAIYVHVHVDWSNDLR